MLFKEEDLIKEVYKNETIYLMYGDDIFATINNSIDINLEFLNSIRSDILKKKMMEKISGYVGHTRFSGIEDCNKIVQKILHDVFPNGLEDTLVYKRIKEALLYSYDNLWFDQRKMMNGYLASSFNNLSDGELDVVISLIIKEDIEFTESTVNSIFKERILDKEILKEKMLTIHNEYLETLD